MPRLIDLWIMDRSEEKLLCPSCGIDISVPLLDRCHKLNVQRRWSSKVTVRCLSCKKFVELNVEWVPEYVIPKLVEI